MAQLAGEWPNLPGSSGEQPVYGPTRRCMAHPAGEWLNATGWRGDGAGPDWMGGGQTGPEGRGRLDQTDIRGAEASHGPRFGTNGHPRRNTDVILRQSKAFFEIFNFR